MQGYNAQAVVAAEQIIVAADISTESLDTANLFPMINSACRELQTAGVTDAPQIVLADAGYWTNEAIETLSARGIQMLVAPDADRRKEPRPGRRSGSELGVRTGEWRRYSSTVVRHSGHHARPRCADPEGRS